MPREKGPNKARLSGQAQLQGSFGISFSSQNQIWEVGVVISTG